MIVILIILIIGYIVYSMITSANKIKELHIYDFDNTLAYTPEPSAYNKQIWFEKTNTKWNHRHGWYYNMDSLDTTVFDISFNKDITDKARNSFKERNIYSVMMTGRNIKFKKKVETLLKRENLQFDMCLFNNVSIPTIEYKLNKLGEYLKVFRKLNRVVIYDDREEHTRIFERYLSLNFKGTFNVVLVK